LKLGRLPYNPDKPNLTIDQHLDSTVLPTPPATVDYLSNVKSWPMYGNDQYGDCVWAMIGHAIEAYSTYGEGQTITITEEDVIKGYEDVTGFNPNDPNTDQGTNIQDALNYWVKTGVGGHKILAFAEVKNYANAKVALDVFGALLVGINFPESAMDQFNAGKPWDVVRGSQIEGGHAIHVGHMDTSNTTYQLVTWGQVEGMTQAFWDKYVEECWIVVAPEWFNAQGNSPTGVNLYGLGQDFAAITGKPNPFPNVNPQPTPTPNPTPTPEPAQEPSEWQTLINSIKSAITTLENEIVKFFS